jgi:hypothetical protein
MSPLLAFVAAFFVTYIVGGYLTLRFCFWIVERRERRTS